MADWTDEEIATLRAAVSSGVLSVTYDGPPKRTVTYHSLKEMRDLLSEMERVSDDAPRYRVVSTRKGL